jgi:protein phosphatase
MPEYLIGTDTNPGGRKYNEDRCATARLATAGGLELTVAVLCDGVGGEARGERAAQLAIDTFLSVLQRSEDTDVLKVLVNSVKEANFAVHTEARRLGSEGRMACTMVVAAVDAQGVLHITNCGDSRIYLCRDGQLVQLTRDHIFENVMVWLGKLSKEAAAANPEANKVMRALGIKETIQVDVGFYHDTEDYGEANRRGKNGMPLKAGDSVLLCSDGLIKKTPATKQHLITNDEITRILSQQEGEKAAQALMSLALGRIPVGEQVDNITVAVLQTPDPRRAANLAQMRAARAARERRETRRKVVLAALAVAVPLGLLLVVTMAAFAGFFAVSSNRSAGTATGLAQATAVALAASQTVAAYTPTSTPSPTASATSTIPPTRVPTAVAGEIAKVFDGEEVVGIVIDNQRELVVVPVEHTRYVAVTFVRYRNPDNPSDGNIYLESETRLQFGVVSNNQFQFTVLPGSDLFVQTGPFARGAEVLIPNSSVVVAGLGCLSLQFLDPRTLTVGCYDGECSYTTEIGADMTALEPGGTMRIDLGDSVTVTPAEITDDDRRHYWELLPHTGAGRQDSALCNIPDYSATQVARNATALAATVSAASTRAAAPTSTIVVPPSATVGAISNNNNPPPDTATNPPPPPTPTRTSAPPPPPPPTATTEVPPSPTTEVPPTATTEVPPTTETPSITEVPTEGTPGDGI